MDNISVNEAGCSNSPPNYIGSMCECGDQNDDQVESILPGMSSEDLQFKPYCEPSGGDKSNLKSFRSVVQRHFVKDKLFNLVTEFLRSVEDEKRAQLDVIASFEQVREVTAPIRNQAILNKVNTTIVPKRRKSRSNIPLLERIEQTRREQTVEAEGGETETTSTYQTVGAITIDSTEVGDKGVLEEELNIKANNGVKGKLKEPVYLDDDDLENNNDKSTVNQQQQNNALFKRRRSISSLPGILEKCRVMKFMRNPNNIREIDKLVLESMEENTYTPRSWRQRPKKKKKSTKIEKNDPEVIEGPPKKQCDVVIEVEPDSDSDEDKVIIINECPPRPEPEEDRFSMPPNRKYTVNLSGLDTIAEVSHESFSTFNGTREPSPRVIESRQRDRRAEERHERTEKYTNQTAGEINGVTEEKDTTETSERSSRHQNRKKCSSASKAYGKNNSVNVLNGNLKQTRPVSKEKQKRATTLDILDVYEENADLQRIASSPRRNHRSKSAKPRLAPDHRSRSKSPSKQNKPTPTFDHFITERKTEEHDQDENLFELRRSKTSMSPRDSTDSLDEAETYFSVLKNSQKDRRYKRPDKVLWYDLDLTEGGYKVCNGSGMHGSFNRNSDALGLNGTWNLPIHEAIKNIRGTKTVPQIRQMNDTVPREQRVGRLYKSLRKNRSKSARNEYRMLKTPSLEEYGYYID